MLILGGILFGLLFGKAILSIGMILLSANAVFNQRIGSIWLRFRSEPILLALTGLFFLYFLSGLYSENLDYWVDRSRMKLPFLLMPFAFLSIPTFNERWGWPLLLGFCGLVLLGCGYSLAQFAVAYDVILEGYKQGQVLPTIIQHIRFSLMVVYCFALCVVFWEERPLPQLWLRWAAGLGALFFFFFLHVLAVRSGLLALYLVVAFLALRIVWRRTRSVIGMGLFLVVGLGFTLATYRFVPTIYNKVNYTLYSLDQIRQGKDVGDYSDSHRLGTIWAGLQMGSDHPLIGVGVGDVRDAMDGYLAQRFPSLAGFGYLPHNQYVLVFAATGLLGLLYFSFATILPWFYRRAYQYPLITAFHLIALSSFLVEHTLETQIGTAFYLVFTLIHFRLFLAKSVTE